MSRVLSQRDKERIEEQLDQLVWNHVLTERSGQYEPIELRRLAIARDPHLVQYFQARQRELRDSALVELEEQYMMLSVEIGNPGLGLVIQPSVLADLIFNDEHPLDMPIFKFQSANRVFSSQEVGDPSFDMAATRRDRARQSMYGWMEKNRRIKGDLALDWIHSRLKDGTGRNDLFDDLATLFDQFLPSKRFQGLKLNDEGRLIFAVELEDGTIHDLDELSSGEKETIYGYLDLQSNTPDGSIVLFDEPELHLNPVLLTGSVDFYAKNLAQKRSCQVWLVTHSDSILRQAYGNTQYSVVHLSRSDASAGANQASDIGDSRAVEEAIAALVGELPGFQPRLKTVILEGSGGDLIDQRILRSLFPDFCATVNLISGGSKAAVRALRDALGELPATHPFAGKFFSITDLDDEGPTALEEGLQYRWDAYHIENYLLDPESVNNVLSAIRGAEPSQGDIESVRVQLRASAEGIIGGLVRHRLTTEIRNAILGAVVIGGSPKPERLKATLVASAEGTFTRLKEVSGEWSSQRISARVEELTHAFKKSLEDETWIKKIPGREILNNFVSGHVDGVSYEAFRNLLLEDMRKRRIQPSGIAAVLKSIESAA